jgi:hypothetical protein
MNINNIGQEVAIIKDDTNNKNIHIFVSEEQDNNKNKLVHFFNSLELKEGHFQVVPDKKKDRTSVFVVGRNGSGKSYWIRDYVLEFIKRFPLYKIYLFSSKEKDDNLDKITKIKRVKIDDSFITNPMNYETLTETLCIFDDVDALRDKLKKEIYHLRDTILRNGRSYKIHIISTNHDATGKDIQACLNESDMIVFFMKNYNRCLRYFLENYIGLDQDQVKILRRNRTRATAYIKTYPNVIVQEKNIYTFDGLEM